MSDQPPPVPSGEVPPPYEAAMAPYGPIGTRRSIVMVILLSVVTCGIWTYVWSYQNGDEIKRHSGDGLGGVVYLLFTIFVAPVTMFLMAGEVEKLYRRENREPPITTLWGLWFLLPLIGNIIWYVRIQNAINDYWTSHGATNNPGL